MQDNINTITSGKKNKKYDYFYNMKYNLNSYTLITISMFGLFLPQNIAYISSQSKLLCKIRTVVCMGRSWLCPRRQQLGGRQKLETKI